DGIGLDFEHDVALGDAPAIAVIARGDGAFAHGLLARQQHFGHGPRARAGFLVGEQVRLAKTQAEHPRRMRLDYQAQPVAGIEVDAAGARRKQLDRFELGSVGIVEFGRHRVSPGLSQNQLKDAILTDLALEINSVPVFALHCEAHRAASRDPSQRSNHSLAASWKSSAAIYGTVLRASSAITAASALAGRDGPHQ